MTEGNVRVAVDCAVLPTPAGMLVYQGKTGRSYRVAPGVGRHLADSNLVGLSAQEQAALVQVGILEIHGSSSGLALKGTALRAGILVALAAGLMAAGWAAAHWARIESYLQVQFGVGRTWLWVPPISLALTVLHEWGHAVALRAIGGRAGRIRLRFGWPWATTEVGPFHLLAPRQSILVITAGMVVELWVLGISLAALELSSGIGIFASIAAVAAIHLAFNLLPLPFGDGRRALSEMVNRVLRI